MATIKVKSVKVVNYRSFGKSKNLKEQEIKFPVENFNKPIAIVGYNNSGKSNLLQAISYGLYEYWAEDNLSLDDFHNRQIKNKPEITLKFQTEIFSPVNSNVPDLAEQIIKEYAHQFNVETEDGINFNILGSINPALGKYDSPQKKKIRDRLKIYNINFHKIKEEINTQKSWGSAKSLLGKHLKRLLNNDTQKEEKEKLFNEEINKLRKNLIKNSPLAEFIKTVQFYFRKNLRNEGYAVEFDVMSFYDFFLKMIFKVGLNGSGSNLIPIEHYGDGYISMFVMAVLQAIIEPDKNSNSKEKEECLFLFEEPESFLHEAHQEYFYKTVLCGLTKVGHQVIYTTHSAKMLDIFDTRGIIRLELNDKYQTEIRYNDIEEKEELVSLKTNNEFIKTVEPNLNRILFSRKTVLVEGPNDILVYQETIKQKVLAVIQGRKDIEDKKLFAETYLNFENISMIAHHGKGTAYFLVELCKQYKLDYFIITDWDFEESELKVEDIESFKDEDSLKASDCYQNSSNKGTVTTNWKLLQAATKNQIHFNVKKLETVIELTPPFDKDSQKIWEHIKKSDLASNEKLFPKSLEKFLEIDKL